MDFPWQRLLRGESMLDMDFHWQRLLRGESMFLTQEGRVVRNTNIGLRVEGRGQMCSLLYKT